MRQPLALRIARMAALIIAVIACANILVFIVERTWAMPVRVPSHSMEPTLRPGDRVLLRRTQLSRDDLRRTLRRGDIVVFESPTSSRTLLIKRVVALPGETIELHHGILAIDDTMIVTENWLDDAPRADVLDADVPATKLGRRELYVLGDNRADSVDSRTFGPIDIGDVRGVATRIIWPPARWGAITGAHDRDG